MLSPSVLSAQDFAELKYSLPEAGRWHELHDGQTVLLSAPDDIHGTIVLNLSRALAEWFRKQPRQARGYACHDLGLHVHSEPDTVYVPAMSIFREGKPFGQFDNVIATEIPRIVIDVASSHDRRRDMRLRTTAYMKYGVECVWVINPETRRSFIHTTEGSHEVKDGILRNPAGDLAVPLSAIFGD